MMRFKFNCPKYLSGHEHHKLAYIYGDNAYYFDFDAINDENATISVLKDDAEKKNRLETRGLEAANSLIKSIIDYSNNGGDVWIADWFRDSVNIVLNEEKKQHDVDNKKR